jgi:hypothetical protein
VGPMNQVTAKRATLSTPVLHPCATAQTVNTDSPPHPKNLKTAQTLQTLRHRPNCECLILYRLRIRIYPVRTSQETHSCLHDNDQTNQLMLFSKEIAVYGENHTEHTDTSVFVRAVVSIVTAVL